MKVLFVSSEVAPYSTTGGLGEVAGALPRALAELGHEVWVVTPRYGSISRSELQPVQASFRLRFPFGEERCELMSASPSSRLRVLFVEHPGFFEREGLYGNVDGDYPDNARRFAFFSMAALAACGKLSFAPDIVHLNDWQTGLAALAAKRGFSASIGAAKSVLMIHNMAYQGIFPREAMEELGLPTELFTPAGIEFHGNLSFLKAGLVYSDFLATVSPRYAQEIQTPEFGAGLEGLLRARSPQLMGILNGIDTSEWNPSADRFLKHTFDAQNLAGKRQCKQALLEAYGLPADEEAMNRPLFASVSRLVAQKGIDLLISAMRTFAEEDISFVALGSGEARLEASLRELQARFPGKVSVRIGFDRALSHLVEAGADFFAMPSRFEPCGLNQMYSLRYGTVPVVRGTGGLDDTVVDLSLPGGNGIKFFPPERIELLHALGRAVALYRSREQLREVQKRGMRQDFSWRISAEKYVDVYRALTGAAKAHGRESLTA
jgi:starch synthase